MNDSSINPLILWAELAKNMFFFKKTKHRVFFKKKLFKTNQAFSAAFFRGSGQKKGSGTST